MSKPQPKIALPNLKAALDAGEGLTQRGLAAFLGTHESNVSRLIRGKATMLTRERIELIERYTGRSFDYLAGLKEANLMDVEADMVAARRQAPPAIQAAVDALLEPYKPR